MYYIYRAAGAARPTTSILKEGTPQATTRTTTRPPARAPTTATTPQTPTLKADVACTFPSRATGIYILYICFVTFFFVTSHGYIYYIWYVVLYYIILYIVVYIL